MEHASTVRTDACSRTSGGSRRCRRWSATQVLRAAHRSDLPSFPNQDPSGTFGDPNAPPLRIVALGDSSITAPGVEDLDNTWVRRVARDLAEHHQVELISLAVGGSKARDVIEGQLAEAIRLRPGRRRRLGRGQRCDARRPPAERYRAELPRSSTGSRRPGPRSSSIGMGDMASIPRLPPICDGGPPAAPMCSIASPARRRRRRPEPSRCTPRAG